MVLKMSKVLIINSESMGNGSIELGARLMNVFLHKLMLAQEKPDTIILYNSGVNLAAEGSATAEAFSELTKEGVQILACGTCLEYYKLKDKLKGARISNMDEISTIMFQAESVITV